MYFWLKYYMYGLRKKRNSFSLDAFYMSGPLSVHFNGGGGGVDYKHPVLIKLKAHLTK